MQKRPLHAAEPDLGHGIYALPTRAEDAFVHLLSVPFEATVSYGRGTAGGPAAIREESVQVDLLDPHFGRFHRVGIYAHPIPDRIRQLSDRCRRAAEPIIERMGEIGDDPELKAALAEVDRGGASIAHSLAKRTAALLEADHAVGVIGGEHSVSFGAIQAHARRFPGLGVLQIDAHADLRAAYEGFTWSHASVMRNVLERIPRVSRLVQVGIRDYCDEELSVIRQSEGRVRTWFDKDLRAQSRRSSAGFAGVVPTIVAALPQEVYISFDIDGLDPALCPHTGTPVPGGLSFEDATLLLDEVVRSGRRIVGFDLVEVAPGPQGDVWDANVGARMLYRLIGALVRSRMVAYCSA